MCLLLARVRNFLVSFLTFFFSQALSRITKRDVQMCMKLLQGTWDPCPNPAKIKCTAAALRRNGQEANSAVEVFVYGDTAARTYCSSLRRTSCKQHTTFIYGPKDSIPVNGSAASTGSFPINQTSSQQQHHPRRDSEHCRTPSCPRWWRSSNAEVLECYCLRTQHPCLRLSPPSPQTAISERCNDPPERS